MRLLVLDGNSIINRAFYGIKLLTTKDGQYTNALYGFLNIFQKLRDQTGADHIAAAFDLPAPTFRHRLYGEYKAGRKGMPDELASQLPLLKELLTLMGVTVVEAEGYEADDILGTLSAGASARGGECFIATGDRDSLQLVDDHVTVLLAATKMGRPETTVFDPACHPGKIRAGTSPADRPEGVDGRCQRPHPRSAGYRGKNSPGPDAPLRKLRCPVRSAGFTGHPSRGTPQAGGGTGQRLPEPEAGDHLPRSAGGQRSGGIPVGAGSEGGAGPLVGPVGIFLPHRQDGVGCHPRRGTGENRPGRPEMGAGGIRCRHDGGTGRRPLPVRHRGRKPRGPDLLLDSEKARKRGHAGCRFPARRGGVYRPAGPAERSLRPSDHRRQ